MFTQGSDSDETLKLPVTSSNVKDHLTQVIGDLNIFDVLNNNQNSSSDKDLTEDENDFGSPLEARKDNEMIKSGVPIKKLKSSLKLSSSPSTTSSTSGKIVRFAPQLTQVRRFDLNSEPMSISTETSPCLTPIDDLSQSYMTSSYWFGTNMTKLKLDSYNKPFSKFSLFYDGETDSETDDEKEIDFSIKGYLKSNTSNDVLLTPSFNIRSWRLISTNSLPFSGFKLFSQNLSLDLLSFLQGQNIRLNKIDLMGNKLIGKIFVTNLNYEKFLEIKFTFNNWQDIHYVDALFSKTITNEIDEFEFIIDLSTLKFFMVYKKLIYCNSMGKETKCNLRMDLCCKYDVNGETYYDNNNYENYQINLKVTTQPLKLTHQRSASLPSNFNLPMIENDDKRPSLGSRTFSDDTDYYNTSPLKHLYHNNSDFFKSFMLDKSKNLGNDVNHGISINNSGQQNLPHVCVDNVDDDDSDLSLFGERPILNLNDNNANNNNNYRTPDFSNASETKDSYRTVCFPHGYKNNTDRDLFLPDNSKDDRNHDLFTFSNNNDNNNHETFYFSDGYENIIKNYCFYSSSGYDTINFMD